MSDEQPTPEEVPVEEAATPVHIDTKKSTQLLRVELTSGELLDLGDRLANAQQKSKELNDELKSIKDGYKAKLSAVEAEEVNVGNLVRQKYEMRDIECELELNFDEGVVTITRLDTDEVVESRPMTNKEKARELDLWPKVEEAIPDKNAEPAVTPEEIASAIGIIQETKRASITAIQRRMGIAERRAWMIIDRLEELKVVGPPVGDGEPREILMDEVALARFREDYPERAEEKAVEEAKEALADEQPAAEEGPETEE